MLKELFQSRNSQPTTDRFKAILHILLVMTDEELEKVEKMIDIVFEHTTEEKKSSSSSKLIIPESDLDDKIEEAKSSLKTEELEKRIEEFRQLRKI
uniref:hypothetical protein n=1 Tax=Streptococcus salivarius TaxID=1304 RepID=UPI0015EE5129|nr:hypothetical protein [Streptococcus salivarius]